MCCGYNAAVLCCADRVLVPVLLCSRQVPVLLCSCGYSAAGLCRPSVGTGVTVLCWCHSAVVTVLLCCGAVGMVLVLQCCCCADRVLSAVALAHNLLKG